MGAAKPEPGSPGMEFSDFLLRACHDLRGPLRTISVQAELLGRGDAEARLDWIADGAKRIGQLTDGLAAYAIAMQTDEASFGEAKLDLLLRLVLAKLAEEIRSRIAVVTYEALPCVWGNSDRLMQLLENLLLMGIRHGGKGPPQVHITAQPQGEDWLFGVRDNGPGMEPAALAKIFNPLERLRGYEHSYAGMGLAICRTIVERHGGTIWAESQPPGGVTFYFTLRAG